MKQKISIIIPAAGKATRMRPLSSSVSKAMVPVNGKPIISYILDHIFKYVNIEDIVIVQNELCDIENFIKIAYPTYYNDNIIKFAQQKVAEGPLQAIHIGDEYLTESNAPVMIWLGDTICLETNFDFNKSFLVTSKVNDFQRWCLVDAENNFYDKPEIAPRTDNALIGIYYFHNRKLYNESLSEAINKPKLKGEYQISSLLNSYINSGVFFNLIDTNEWYDCGELQTYYESKAKLLNNSARAFNKISVDTFLGIVTKSSDDISKQEKIKSEKNWFKLLPEEASLFCPRILESEDTELRMSQEPGIPLNEMWLYEDLKYDTWTQIIDKVMKIHNKVFFKESSSIINKKKLMEEMYINKNIKRLNDYRDFPEFDVVYNFVKEVGEDLVNSGIKWSKYMHGDSHLGNILFEPTQGSIKFIDPRGSFGNIIGTEGDMRYDMAKFTQDFYLGYADILAGNYKLTDNKELKLYKDNNLNIKLSNYFKIKLKEYGYNPDQIFKLAIVLMITCIPFHYDDKQRQLAFWIQGLNKIKTL